MDKPKLYKALLEARADVVEARYQSADIDGDGAHYEALMSQEHRINRLLSIVKHAHNKAVR